MVATAAVAPVAEATETKMLVVVSGIKEYVKAREMRTALEFPEAMSNHIAGLIDRAIERCKARNQSTLQPFDI